MKSKFVKVEKFTFIGLDGKPVEITLSTPADYKAGVYRFDQKMVNLKGEDVSIRFWMRPKGMVFGEFVECWMKPTFLEYLKESDFEKIVEAYKA